MELSADEEEAEGGEAEHISRHIRIQYSRVQGRKDVVPEEQQSGWVKILMTQTIHILLLYEYIYIYIHGTAPTRPLTRIILSLCCVGVVLVLYVCLTVSLSVWLSLPVTLTD